MATLEPPSAAGKDFAEDFHLWSAGLLPDPFGPQPEPGQYLAAQLTLAKFHFPVLLVWPQAVERYLFQLLVDDPVFRDAIALVLLALLVVVAFDAVRRD